MARLGETVQRVLMLSARWMRCADDHLLKPSGAGKLLARVRVRWRRRAREGADGSATVEFGNVRIAQAEAAVGYRFAR